MTIEVQSDDRQVAAMNRKADDIRAAGWAEGLGMVAEGGFSLAASTEMVPEQRRVS
jgi:hypothetical protein